MSMEGMRYWMCGQADHAIFVRDDLTDEHVKRADKAWDYSLKFRELESAAMRGEEKPDSFIGRSRSQPNTLRCPL